MRMSLRRLADGTVEHRIAGGDLRPLILGPHHQLDQPLNGRWRVRPCAKARERQRGLASPAGCLPVTAFLDMPMKR